MRELTPRQIVAELDAHIIGQAKAKRAVAVALRNRYRRMQLPQEMRDEVSPKNILMIGPTGVGKTEVARRLAKLVVAPFVKVEATRFTEVGYVGRDADSMVRDLVEIAIRMVKERKTDEVHARAEAGAEKRLLDALSPLPKRPNRVKHPLEAFWGGTTETPEQDTVSYESELQRAQSERERVRARLAAGQLENATVEIEVDSAAVPTVEIFDGMNVQEMGINLQDVLGGLMPKRQKKRQLSVAEARRILFLQEAARLIDQDSVAEEAIRLVEERGIVFIDEIDKVAGRERGVGPDVSREGVQRDILPILEGATVMTKHGPVATDHILFIAAGAFHVSKPSDLIPELQGRFPIRVEFESLGKEEFVKILTEPKNSLTRQYVALLQTEGLSVRFTDDGIDEIAEAASTVNEQNENIGARRLHTVLETILEDVAYEAPDMQAGEVTIDRQYVQSRLTNILDRKDLSRYIL